MRRSTLFATTLLATFCLSTEAFAQTAQAIARPQARILKAIDNTDRVTLRGNVHPFAAIATASQAVEDSTPMERMVLMLKGDTTQEAALEQLIAAQNDPKSSLYHHYLAPNEFGAQFGVADADITKVTDWLESHGFKVDELSVGKRAIVFSGTVGQVAAAFNTEIRTFTVAGVTHYANTTDPTIPAALSSAVAGVVKMHDFRHSANSTKTTAVSGPGVVNPLYTSGSAHYLSPADYGTIYNINPLYSAGINGTGQTIAVLARSNISMSDVSSFRSTMGLKANNPCRSSSPIRIPGVVQGDNEETTLDTEWSGAIAPNATVKVIVSASTNSADGIDLSALYAVNNKVAPIVSLSYGSCEQHGRHGTGFL